VPAPGNLDAVFDALANGHRRQIVHELGQRPCSISELAHAQGLSLPAIHRHIEVLESAGMVARRKVGRSNVLALKRDPLRRLREWADGFHPYWGNDLERLENYAEYLDRRQSSTKGQT
jgi:DNA-binding transcriptional ArsR family regulator